MNNQCQGVEKQFFLKIFLNSITKHIVPSKFNKNMSFNYSKNSAKVKKIKDQ